MISLRLDLQYDWVGPVAQNYLTWLDNALKISTGNRSIGLHKNVKNKNHKDS